MFIKKIAVMAGAGILLAACIPKPNSPQPTPAAIEQAKEAAQEAIDKSPKLVTLMTQNNLGQSGVATLTATDDGKTKVQLSMAGGTFTDPQPAHIHLGSCPSPGDV